MNKRIINGLSDPFVLASFAAFSALMTSYVLPKNSPSTSKLGIFAGSMFCLMLGGAVEIASRN